MAATGRKPPVIAAVAAAACLASLLFYEWRFSVQERGQQRVTVLFRTENLEEPIAILPSLLPGSTSPAGGEFRVVSTEAQKSAGVNTTELQRNAVFLACRVHPCTSTEGVQGYVAPGLAHSRATGLARYRDAGFRFLAMGVSTLLAAAGAFLLASAGGRLPRAVLGLGVLRLASLFWFFGLFGFFSTFFEDERIYRYAAERLLHWGTQHSQYRFPIGLPLLYAPLLAVIRNPDPRFFAMVFALISMATFGVGAVGAMVFMLNRAGLPLRASLGGGLAVVLYPWLMSTVMKRAGSGAAYGSFIGLLSFVPVDANYPIVRMFATWIGYNAMSDTPALVIGLLGVALIARQPTPRRLFLAGLLLGLGFLVRLMNVFYLVPAALLLAEEESGRGPRGWLALGGGLVVATLPQLIWNAAVFGSPWTFGYRFDPAPSYRGFEWSFFPGGVKALAAAHFQLLALAGAALLLLRRRAPRCASLVAALIGPTLFYYCGYFFAPNDPVRLTLMPLLLMVVTVGSAMAGDGEQRWILAAAVAVALAYSPGLGVGPLFSAWPPWLAPVACVVLAGLAAFRSRDWILPAALLVLATGSSLLAAGGFAGALVWILLEAALRLGRSLRFAPARLRAPG